MPEPGAISGHFHSRHLPSLPLQLSSQLLADRIFSNTVHMRCYPGAIRCNGDHSLQTIRDSVAYSAFASSASPLLPNISLEDPKTIGAYHPLAGSRFSPHRICHEEQNPSFFLVTCVTESHPPLASLFVPEKVVPEYKRSISIYLPLRYRSSKNIFPIVLIPSDYI